MRTKSRIAAFTNTTATTMLRNVHRFMVPLVYNKRVLTSCCWRKNYTQMFHGLGIFPSMDSQILMCLTYSFNLHILLGGERLPPPFLSLKGAEHITPARQLECSSPHHPGLTLQPSPLISRPPI